MDRGNNWRVDLAYQTSKGEIRYLYKDTKDYTGYSDEEFDNFDSLNLGYVDGVGYFNKDTGEILSNYSKVPKETPEGCPSEFDSVPQMKRYLGKINKIGIQTKDNTQKLHDAVCGHAVRGGERIIFTKPQYKVVEKLAKNLDYRNLIFASRERLSDILEVSEKKVMDSLKTAKSLVEVTKLKKDHYKVELSPVYAYKHYAGNLKPESLPMITAMKDWYIPEGDVEAIIAKQEEGTTYLDWVRKSQEEGEFSYRKDVWESIKPTLEEGFISDFQMFELDNFPERVEPTIDGDKVRAQIKEYESLLKSYGLVEGDIGAPCLFSYMKYGESVFKNAA